MSANAIPTTAAKGETAEAIATLLNRDLQLEGITAQVFIEKDRLQIVLESVRVPGQKALTQAIRLLDNSEVQSVKQVQIYGKKTGDKFPSWHEEFDLPEPLVIDSATTSTLQTLPDTADPSSITAMALEAC